MHMSEQMPLPGMPTAPDQEVFGPPAVANSPTGEIPKAVYTARVKRATDGLSNSSNMRMLTFECEIISPDQVPSQTNPDVIVQTAGRSFTMYAVIDRTSKAYDGAYKLLNKMLLLFADGTFNPAAIINELNKGMTFFDVILQSSEDFHRLPKKPGQKEGEIMCYPGTNKKISRGYRIDLPGEESIIGRVAAPEGFVAPQF